MSVIDRLNGLWTPAAVQEIAQGDMPGDKIMISEEHVKKAQTLFLPLISLLRESFTAGGNEKAVVAVCGGSGVGKSEIASLLSHYLREMGVGSYTLSGDNYPHRIPMYNDAERLRVFREGGLRGMVAGGGYNADRAEQLRALQKEMRDADPAACGEYPWLALYQAAGARRLGEYLGSREEIDFDELSRITAQFHQGAPDIWLKRMGREETELWYERVDMRGVHVLMIEWTHGNSDHFQGVDIPILLNSTPAETLAHRRARNRDGGTDSPFTTMVLGIEQRMLEAQARKAKLILSKSGEIMTYSQYRRLMADQ